MTIEQNLATVAAHIENEARDPGGVLPLYTDDIVQEFPSRGLRFEGKKAIEANYRRMFASVKDIELFPIDRFATNDRVVDDMLVHLTLTGDGMVGAPVRIGKPIALRLVHIFHMREGLIAKEIVHENWQERAE